MHRMHRATSRAAFVLPIADLDFYAWCHIEPAVYSSADVGVFEHGNRTAVLCLRQWPRLRLHALTSNVDIQKKTTSRRCFGSNWFTFAFGVVGTFAIPLSLDLTPRRIIRHHRGTGVLAEDVALCDTSCCIPSCSLLRFYRTTFLCSGPITGLSRQCWRYMN